MYHSFGIYAIVNKVNGMAYVGQTSDSFGSRRDCHFASLRGGYGVNNLIQEDWDKYGGDNFEFVILKKCSDEDDLDKLEREFIARQRLSGCYNIGDGGAEAPNTGKHLSEETKKKIGIKNAVNGLGRKATDETKARMSEAQAKRWSGIDECKRKEITSRMSDATRGKKWDDEKKSEYSKSQWERPHAAKIDADTVRRIRQMYDDGLGSIADIARCFNMNKCTVGAIIRFERWKHI